MPRWREQKRRNFPAASVRLKVIRWPGARPALLNRMTPVLTRCSRMLWVTVPRLVTTKVTVPCGAVALDSETTPLRSATNRVLAVAVELAWDGAAASAWPPRTTLASRTTATSGRRLTSSSQGRGRPDGTGRPDDRFGRDSRA